MKMSKRNVIVKTEIVKTEKEIKIHGLYDQKRNSKNIINI